MNFFISDNHFNHKNIIKYCFRPFESVEQMDEAMIKNWNDIVSIDDTVYHLGDFSLSYKKTCQVLPLLKGKKILIKGNHDESLEKMISAGFSEAYQTLKIKLNNRTVILQHRPTSLNGYDASRWQISGHTHNKTTLVDYNKKIINVSVENINYTPISEKEILKLLK